MSAGVQHGLGRSSSKPELLPDSDSQANVAAKVPFVPETQNVGSALGDNRRIIFVGGGIALVVLLLAFSSISQRLSRNSGTTRKTQMQPAPKEAAGPALSRTPILEADHSPEQEKDGSLLSPNQIARTSTRPLKEAHASTLDELPPFNSSTWQPAPYHPGIQPSVGVEPEPGSDSAQGRNLNETMDKPSIVFITNSKPVTSNPSSYESVSAIEPLRGLWPGMRLRARLQAAINTAVMTPVVAVIEYNYEENGEIVVPAGAKVVGHLESADRSGYLGIHFDVLLLPDGSSTNLTAIATDLRLQPLRGKVEGRHAGKRMLARSLAGIGEITAAIAGRGSLNQPLSEGDLVRERVSNNMGQAADQSVTQLALTERIVVSVPADTEIYIILQKAAQSNERPSESRAGQTQSNIETLRELLQLQREMNQAAEAKTFD